MSDKSKSPPQKLHQKKFNIQKQHSTEKVAIKNYQPSRFVVAERLQPITYKAKEVLNDFQTKIREFESTNLVSSLQPSQQRVLQPKEYKKKPLRRQENDMQMYKDIFVQPKADALQELKEKEKDFEALFHKGQAKQYDKILNIREEEEKPQPKQKNLLGTLLNNEQLMKSTFNDNIDLKKEIDKVQQMDLPVHPDANLNFFDQQIQVQPPDLPNASIASPLTPGNGYAPSIPLTHNFKESKTSIKDLLVRAKAGMQAGDIQKEAHLSFYLGMVYESSKNYNEAVRFYKKFVACAKLMEDKIGMALGTNRVALNYYNSNNFQKSIEFHKQNLSYSDQENMFAGLYNLGIALRRIRNYDESIEYFSSGLEWAQRRDEAESQCITYGQLGMVYIEIKQYSLAYENFQNCYELARRLKNYKLQLDCLLNLIKISSYLQISIEQQTQTLRSAIQCSNQLGLKSVSTLCLCNLGVLESNPKKNNQQYDDLEFEEF